MEYKLLSFNEWLKEWGDVELESYCSKCLYDSENEDMSEYWHRDEYFISCDISDGCSKDECPYLNSHLKEAYEDYLIENNADEETIEKLEAQI